MSARVKFVNKAQKDQGQCERCGVPLPKGSAYLYFKVGFRSQYKHVRCMDAACAPKRSELTSSRVAEAYAAQESATVSVDAATSREDIQAAIDECASAAEDLIGEYEGSIDSAPMLEDQLRPTVDALESWRDELQSVDLPEEDDEEEQEEGTTEEALEEMRDAARQAIDSLEI